MDTNALVIANVTRWLNEVVIGLNLCPFSAKPTRENRVRFVVSNAQEDEDLLQDLQREMELLDEKPASEIETTLVIIPNHLQDFFDYNQFLNWADQLLKRNRWIGVYQIATFHPDYCFADAEPDDAENLTNRAPYPVLHIIREASLEKALEYFADVDEIPEINKARVESLTAEEKQKLFPYLFDK
ncbi:DUF1415 domain-containing protein [Cellvibrio sp. pealriver]|uniref:DUF1415 domain-containing protein n=1 Tax=Cellvibrio sp. pealriver TaxID=1622269 RepID=UPI00066FDC11|nr:DUF1415 domain-containing protein [Cellvibrio sp. pealriver]